MIRTFTMLCAALIWAGPAAAQSKDKPSEKQTAQQERMKSCNAQAARKDLKGDKRRDFMSDYLGG